MQHGTLGEMLGAHVSTTIKMNEYVVLQIWYIPVVQKELCALQFKKQKKQLPPPT